MTSANLPLSITTGDPDGIGLEVTIKAINKLPKKFSHPVVIYCEEPAKKILRRLPKHIPASIVNSGSPVEWVLDSAKKCLSGEHAGLVTGPLSKTLISFLGYDSLGHTELLKKVSNTKDVFMAFLGDKFNVLLVTGHIPLQKIASQLSPDLIIKALLVAQTLRPALGTQNQKRPFGLLGLNPHAGDAGLIGKEESSVIASALSSPVLKSLNVRGPLVPDVAFLPSAWKNFSIYIALYHDQGLIPFKLVHGFDSGVQVSCGLPFVRTSVDHGTAKDIFGKSKANPNSMLQAILWAEKLSKLRRLK